MSFIPDKSGIKSLTGFSFQIKVFCCLSAEMAIETNEETAIAWLKEQGV